MLANHGMIELAGCPSFRWDILDRSRDLRLMGRHGMGSSTMTEFVAAMYEIMRGGRHVAGGFFQTPEEILERIRSQPAGAYTVHRQLTPHQESGETAFWGIVAHFGAGKIAFDPSAPED
jgi:hypothetical protein